MAELRLSPREARLGGLMPIDVGAPGKEPGPVFGSTTANPGSEPPLLFPVVPAAAMVSRSDSSRSQVGLRAPAAAALGPGGRHPAR